MKRYRAQGTHKNTNAVRFSFHVFVFVLKAGRWKFNWYSIVIISFPFFSLVQQPKSGPGRLIIEVSWSHKIRHTHTHPVGLLWASDQPVAEAATYTTHNKHNRRTSMPSAGFEPAIPAIERLQTYPLGRTATGICLFSIMAHIITSATISSIVVI